jgi:hypothetical protein
VKEAPAQEWGKDYAKEDYAKAYVCVALDSLQVLGCSY